MAAVATWQRGNVVADNVHAPCHRAAAAAAAADDLLHISPRIPHPTANLEILLHIIIIVYKRINSGFNGFPLLSILCIYISFFYFRMWMDGRLACVCMLAACTVLKDFDEVLTNRARHVVTEIQRTVEAAEALKRRDFKKVSIFVYQTSIFILYPHIFQRVKLNCYCVRRRRRRPRRCACVFVCAA